MRIRVNGDWQEQDRGLSVSALLAKLALDQRRVAIEHNRRILPRDHYPQTLLADQDELEIVTLVGGG